MYFDNIFLVILEMVMYNIRTVITNPWLVRHGFILVFAGHICHVKFIALTYLRCFVLWDESSFFLPSFVSVYHSKQATEISLWKPVYGLPPHMFAVSLWGGQAGNERLLLWRETRAFYLLPPVPLSSVRDPHLPLSLCLCLCLSLCIYCLFSYHHAGKHDARPITMKVSRCFGATVVFFCLAQLNDTPTAHTGPAGLDRGIFQVLAGGKTSAQQQTLCLFFFLLSVYICFCVFS